MTQWSDVQAQRRWMPIGRADDPKAPAEGYKSNAPAGWLRRLDVRTPLAGINFGFGGLLALDFDMKPELLDANGRAAIGAEFRRVMDALPGPIEVSHSGNGAHLFAIPDADLAAELADVARKPYVLARHKGEKGYSTAAAVELFGCGNAYIAATESWVGERVPSGALPVIAPAHLWSVLDALPVVAKPTEARRRNASQMPMPTPPPGAYADAYAKLAPVLSQIPVPGDYFEWLGLVSSLASAGFGEAEIETWSAGGPSYVKGEVARKWGHLLAKYSPATAIAAAQDAGLLPRRFVPERQIDWQPAAQDAPKCGVCGATSNLVRGRNGDYWLCKDPHMCAAQCRANQAKRAADGPFGKYIEGEG